MRTQPRKHHPMPYRSLPLMLRTTLQTVALVFCLAAVANAAAGPLRDRLGRSADASEMEDSEGRSAGAWALQALPPGLRLLRDVAYGPDAQQRMDIYVPDRVQAAPVLFLVHGGGWRRGDKAHDRLVQNKLAHWAAQGVVLVSVNYRMLPEARPDAQARDVALALSHAQQQAHRWGGDARRFVLMGHSAGAHLVSLLAVSPERLRATGAQPVLGTVALDSGAMDVEQTMEERHAPLFDKAFGSDPAYWRSVSPQHQWQPGAAPMLVVCSSLRRSPCPQARAFAARGEALGARVTVLPQPLSHGDVNETLGLPGPYTAAVDSFLRTLPGWTLP